MIIEQPDQPIRVIIAEGHELIRLGLHAFIDNSPSLLLVGETDCFKYLAALVAKYHPDVILLDIMLNEGHCLQIVPQLLKSFPKTKVLAFSGYGDQELHLKAIKAGAAGIAHKHHCTELLLKAIHAIHGGEVWFDRQISKLLWQTNSERVNAPDISPRTNSAISQLTKREFSIATLACKGMPAKKIATELSITEKTVRNLLTNIYNKLGVTSQVELCLKYSVNDHNQLSNNFDNLQLKAH